MPNKELFISCPNNPEVACMHPDRCEKCGWNPVVAARRLKEIRKKLGLPVEDIPCQEG